MQQFSLKVIAKSILNNSTHIKIPPCISFKSSQQLFCFVTNRRDTATCSCDVEPWMQKVRWWDWKICSSTKKLSSRWHSGSQTIGTLSFSSGLGSLSSWGCLLSAVPSIRPALIPKSLQPGESVIHYEGQWIP